MVKKKQHFCSNTLFVLYFIIFISKRLLLREVTALNIVLFVLVDEQQTAKREEKPKTVKAARQVLETKRQDEVTEPGHEGQQLH